MIDRPLRILHIDKFGSRSGGGAPTYLLDLVGRQRARGHDAQFLATEGPVDLDSRFRESFPRRIELNPPPSGLTQKVSTVATMIWSRTAAKLVADVLDEFRPDVVHCHNLYHQLSPSVLVPIRERGIRCVMTVHDYKLVCPTYQLTDGSGMHCEACVTGSVGNVVRKRCQSGSLVQSTVLMVESGIHRRLGSYDPVETFLCPSEYLAGLMRDAGFGSRVEHLPLGYDLTSTPVRTSPGRGIAFGGRLSAEKGVDHLIDAVALLPDVELTICGDGPERSALERKAASLLGDRVRFLGHVKRQTLLEVFRGAAVVAVPSVWAENQPISILDALACGVPVVSGNSAALRELVRPGVSGLPVDPRDHHQLADALAQFESNPDLQRTIGISARSFVEKRHELESHLLRLEQIYQDVDRGDGGNAK